MTIVPASDSPVPAGARPLGVRTKPIIRLGMGVKHPEKGYPMKTDYLTVRGDERAVAKFHEVKGDKPKAVEVLLPSTVDQCLTIQYRAFKGGQAEDGGSLVAVGSTNFALRDYCGGPDLLTVWAQDGSVSQVETAGLDAITRQPLDDIAKDLGLELYTTLRAGMPDVLGFGSFFEISTKGKESTDRLWARVRELYALFGSRVTFAVKPQLVIRPSTARPVVVKDGEAKRIKTQIYVLDLVVPESIDEMLARLEERQKVLAPGGAAAALYGASEPLAIAAPPMRPDPDDWEPVEADDVFDPDEDTPGGNLADAPPEGAGGDPQAASEAAAVASDAAPGDEPVVQPPAEPAFKAPAAAVTKAGKQKPPTGANAELTLAEISQTPEGAPWLEWAVGPTVEWPDDFRANLELWTQAKHPDIWKRVRA